MRPSMMAGVDEHGQGLCLALQPLAFAQPRAAALAHLVTRLLGAEAAEAQDRAVAAGADDGEQIAQHECQRQ